MFQAWRAQMSLFETPARMRGGSFGGRGRQEISGQLDKKSVAVNCELFGEYHSASIGKGSARTSNISLWDLNRRFQHKEKIRTFRFRAVVSLGWVPVVASRALQELVKGIEVTALRMPHFASLDDCVVKTTQTFQRKMSHKCLCKYGQRVVDHNQVCCRHTHQ